MPQAMMEAPREGCRRLANGPIKAIQLSDRLRIKRAFRERWHWLFFHRIR